MLFLDFSCVIAAAAARESKRLSGMYVLSLPPVSSCDEFRLPACPVPVLSRKNFCSNSVKYPKNTPLRVGKHSNVTKNN